MKFLIATTKVPKGMEFCDEVRKMAESMGCKCHAIHGRPGPGCYNIAIALTGENHVDVLRLLLAALMPARFCITKDEFSGFELHGI